MAAPIEIYQIKKKINLKWLLRWPGGNLNIQNKIEKEKENNNVYYLND